MISRSATALDTLDLTSKIGMPGRVDNIDEHVAVVDGRILCQNRNSALALQVRVVHRALLDPLVAAECAALAKQSVHERCLAVIHMRDDRDVPPERVGGLRRGGTR